MCIIAFRIFENVSIYSQIVRERHPDKMIKLCWAHRHPIADELIRKRMNRLRKAQLLTDMAISSGLKLYHCNKIIMVNASSYVKELMIMIEESNANDSGKLIVIHVNEDHEPFMEAILQFLYLGTLVVEAYNFHGLCKLADKLSVKFLVDGVQNSTNLKRDHALTIEKMIKVKTQPTKKQKRSRFAVSQRIISNASLERKINRRSPTQDQTQENIQVAMPMPSMMQGSILEEPKQGICDVQENSRGVSPCPSIIKFGFIKSKSTVDRRKTRVFGYSNLPITDNSAENEKGIARKRKKAGVVDIPVNLKKPKNPKIANNSNPQTSLTVSHEEEISNKNQDKIVALSAPIKASSDKEMENASIAENTNDEDFQQLKRPLRTYGKLITKKGKPKKQLVQNLAQKSKSDLRSADESNSSKIAICRRGRKRHVRVPDKESESNDKIAQAIETEIPKKSLIISAGDSTSAPAPVVGIGVNKEVCGVTGVVRSRRNAYHAAESKLKTITAQLLGGGRNQKNV